LASKATLLWDWIGHEDHHHRRRDGLLSIVEAGESDGMPPMHLLEGGAGGYPDAKVFIWRRMFIARDSAFKWRLGRDPRS
jgi:hypothetical protein